jgi:hypothetical protein
MRPLLTSSGRSNISQMRSVYVSPAEGKGRWILIKFDSFLRPIVPFHLDHVSPITPLPRFIYILTDLIIQLLNHINSHIEKIGNLFLVLVTYRN